MLMKNNFKTISEKSKKNALKNSGAKKTDLLITHPQISKICVVKKKPTNIKILKINSSVISFFLILLFISSIYQSRSLSLSNTHTHTHAHAHAHAPVHLHLHVVSRAWVTHTFLKVSKCLRPGINRHFYISISFSSLQSNVVLKINAKITKILLLLSMTNKQKVCEGLGTIL